MKYTLLLWGVLGSVFLSMSWSMIDLLGVLLYLTKYFTGFFSNSDPFRISFKQACVYTELHFQFLNIPWIKHVLERKQKGCLEYHWILRSLVAILNDIISLKKTHEIIIIFNFRGKMEFQWVHARKMLLIANALELRLSYINPSSL